MLVTQVLLTFLCCLATENEANISKEGDVEQEVKTVDHPEGKRYG